MVDIPLRVLTRLAEQRSRAQHQLTSRSHLLPPFVREQTFTPRYDRYRSCPTSNVLVSPPGAETPRVLTQSSEPSSKRPFSSTGGESSAFLTDTMALFIPSAHANLP